MATTVMAPDPTSNAPLLKRPRVVRLLIIALLAEIGYAVLNISTMPVYLRDDRQFGESFIGCVLVAFLFCEAIFKSPMGHLADRFGPKRLMLIGPAISVGTSLLSLVIPHTGGTAVEFLPFVLLRGLDGIGAAMLWPAAFSAVGDAVADGERQQAMSFLNLCYMLGIAVAFPIGGVIDDVTHSKQAGMFLAAGLFAAVSFCVWRFVPEIDTASVKNDVPGETGFKEFLKSISQIPSYLLLATITFAGIGFPMAIFKLFPTDQFHFSETQIGALICPGAIAMGIASAPISRFGEKIGRAKAVHLGMGLAAIGMWLIGLGAIFPPMRQAWLLAAGGVPVGIGFLLAIPAWMASVSDINPHCRGANLGAVMTAQGLGAIVGAPIGSTLYEKLQPLGGQLGLGPDFGRYSPFVGCAICITIGWAVGLRILTDRR